MRLASRLPLLNYWNFFAAYALLAFLILSCMGPGNESRSNMLAGESSPYLLQHAENPVHWQAWGDAVWEMAQKEDKLVLISIGYSSCHWCHVMEEETFENDSVARFMNENFINVKVDREERPDVDHVYMTAVQLMTGSGGWPLNVLVLPNGKPLYGGTYHPTEQWMRVLKEINRLYREDPAKANDYADRVAKGVAQVNLIEMPEAEGIPNLDVISEAVALWKNEWDLQWGGFRGDQKFMLPSNLDFLMDYAYLTKDEPSREHVKKTLQLMSRGGVFDQLGGGFYRYSTDPEWRIPHFEKMLYDNAQLLGVYARAYKYFKEPEFRETAERIFNFLKLEMKSPAGGYYAALDADSDGVEGKYYTWSVSGLKSLLGSDFETFADYYGVKESTGENEGETVLYRSQSDAEFSMDRGISMPELRQLKAGWYQLLLEARAQRTRPGLDDKVITSWNALLVSSLVTAYEASENEAYLQEGERLFNLVLAQSYHSGNLQHSFKEGGATQPGFLEDYSYMADAAFRLFQVTADEAYLKTAEELLARAESYFRQDDSPLYRFKKDDELIAPIVKTTDGVMPSPNTVLAGLFLKLGHFKYDTGYLRKHREMLGLLSERFLQSPQNYGAWGSQLLLQQDNYYEVAIVGEKAVSLQQEMNRDFLPNALVVASAKPSELPLYEQRFVDGETYIYVCQNHSCKLPVTTVEKALSQLNE